MKSDKKILQAFRWAVGSIGKGQKEIGQILDVQQPAVSLLLGDKREVKQCHINALAEYMGITPEELMERADRWAGLSASLPTVTGQATASEKAPPAHGRRATDTGNRIELSDHQIMVTRFKDPECGKEINELLLKIEELAPEVLDELRFTLGERLKYLKDSQSSKRPGQQDSSSAS